MIESPSTCNIAPDSELAASKEIFVGLLTGVSNHEAKLATTAIITSQPDVWYSETSLWNEVKLRQGENAGWIPDRKGPIKYCYYSLSPIGLVAKGVINGERGEVSAFKANDEQPEAVAKGLALSGSLMEWSLQFPDISLQKVIGVTHSVGAFRAPEVRYGVLKQLVDNIGSPLSYMDIARPLVSADVDERNVFGAIRELTNNGILKTQQIDVAEDVVLEITGPYQYRGAGLRLEQISEGGQLIYGAIDLLWAKGIKEVSFKEITEAVLEINPEADMTKLRQFWYYGSKTEYVNMPNFKPVSRRMNQPSIVALSPEHTDAIIDLVNRLREIENPDSDLTAHRIKARKMISDQISMAAIYAKAKKFSSNVTGQEESREVVCNSILSIVVDAGKVTVNGVFEALAKTDHRLTEASVRNYLGQLAKNGALIQEKLKLDPTKKREYNFYSVPVAGHSLVV